MNLENASLKQSSDSSFYHHNTVRLDIRVRYAECDAQQVVFNARYADYADLAATEYMRALIGNHKNLLDAGYDFQVVSLHVDWFASAVFDDVLTLTVNVSHIGNTSFALSTQCCRTNSEGVSTQIAQMKTVYVVVDANTFTKAKIPPILLDNLTRKFTVDVNQAG